MRWIPKALLRTDSKGPSGGFAKLTKREFRRVRAFSIAHFLVWVSASIILSAWFWNSAIFWLGGIVLACFIPSGYLSYRSYCKQWERDG